MTNIQIPAGSDLTDYFMAHRKDTRFVLGPGWHTCETGFSFEGEHDHCVLGRNCELVGAGSRLTTISFVCPNLPAEASQIECLTAGSRNGDCDTVKISGVKVRAADHPVNFRDVGIIGIHCWSDRADIRDVVVSNITGSFMPAGEPLPTTDGYGILLNRPGKSVRAGLSIVRDVEVRVVPNPKRSLIYMTGFYPGYDHPEDDGDYQNIVVENRTGQPASVAFGVNGGVVGRNWRCRGRWQHGIFCDCAGGSRILVSDSQFDVEGTAMQFQTESLARTSWSDAYLVNSVIRMRGVASSHYGAALVLQAKGEASIDRAQIRNCVLIRDPGSDDVPLYAGSATGNVKDCGLLHCQTIGAWRGQSTDNPGFSIV